MKCYYQGCTEKAVTKEHIPPSSFFPKGENEQLLTVKSCQLHNNQKSKDDTYVLAHICMSASPSNRSREIFLKKIKPQLAHNNGALKKMLSKGATALDNGAVKYPVDIARFDNFFTALSCGIAFKICKDQVPNNYFIHHRYPSFIDDIGNNAFPDIFREFEQLISGEPMEVLNFGKPNMKNERIYTVKVFGVPGFKSSITIVHLFYGTFKVISLLTNVKQD
jgi:hypothetical protein